MTTVRFLNGLDTIGGNIVEISTATSRVICDFGSTSNPTGDDIEGLIANHDLPDLPDLLKGDNSIFQDEAVFVSHLHLDHTGALPFIKTQIPVYFSKDTFILNENLVKSGMEQKLDLNFKALDYEQSIQIGDLKVTLFQSDHDVIGAVAILIEDGKHAFVHSGDVRLSGNHRARVDHWLNVLAAKKIDLLMLEGTSFSFEDRPVEENLGALTELSLQEKFREYLENSENGLVVINPYPRNVERLIEFARTAQTSNRKLVWEPAYADLMREFDADLPLNVLSDEVMEGYQTISLSEIEKAPTEYAIQNSFENLNALAKFKKVVYLHSNGEPLGDYDPRFAELHTFLTKHEIPFVSISASGHAGKEDLLEIAAKIQADVVVPWHSFHPEVMAEALEAQGQKVLLPQYGKKYIFD